MRTTRPPIIEHRRRDTDTHPHRSAGRNNGILSQRIHRRVRHSCRTAGINRRSIARSDRRCRTRTDNFIVPTRITSHRRGRSGIGNPVVTTRTTTHRDNRTHDQHTDEPTSNDTPPTTGSPYVPHPHRPRVSARYASVDGHHEPTASRQHAHGGPLQVVTQARRPTSGTRWANVARHPFGGRVAVRTRGWILRRS